MAKVKCLFSKHEALSSTTSTSPPKKRWDERDFDSLLIDLKWVKER
jgi:hypothetical protein